MKITKRDLRMISWVNQFGYATAEQIARKFKIAKQIVYRRLRNLEKNGYVIYERILFGQPGVYRPTSEILALAGAELPAVRRISLANYVHTLRLIDVCIDMELKYPNAKIVTEREIRARAGNAGPGQEGHFPDAVISHFVKKFAIEFEKSPKGRNRRQKIQNQFLRGNLPGVGAVDGVWYIVPAEQRALAQQLVAELDEDFFQVYLWPGLEQITIQPQPKILETVEVEPAFNSFNFNFRR